LNHFGARNRDKSANYIADLIIEVQCL